MNDQEEQDLREAYKRKFAGLKGLLVGLSLGVVIGIGQVPNELLKIPTEESSGYGTEPVLSYLAVDNGTLGMILLPLLVVIILYAWFEDFHIDKKVEEAKENEGSDDCEDEVVEQDDEGEPSDIEEALVEPDVDPEELLEEIEEDDGEGQ